MKLEKIIIKKYKSILNPIEIKFNHNELKIYLIIKIMYFVKTKRQR